MKFRFVLILCLFLVFVSCSSDLPKKGEPDYELSIAEYREKLSDPEIRKDELIKMYQQLDYAREIVIGTADESEEIQVQVLIIDVLNRMEGLY